MSESLSSRKKNKYTQARNRHVRYKSAQASSAAMVQKWRPIKKQGNYDIILEFEILKILDSSLFDKHHVYHKVLKKR